MYQKKLVRLANFCHVNLFSEMCKTLAHPLSSGIFSQKEVKHFVIAVLMKVDFVSACTTPISHTSIAV